MAGVSMVTVGEDDGIVRLDRWFRRHYPQVTQGQLQKLLRTKQVKVDGKRAEASQRVSAGQVVRVPPLPEKGSPMAAAKARRDAVKVSDEDAAFVQSLVIYKDNDVLVLNKPAGLAVQGGTGVTRHLDGMLSALRFDKDENPRLVHRLDKDTSGLMVVAKNDAAHRALSAQFAVHSLERCYLALVWGRLNPARGVIETQIGRSAVNRKKMAVLQTGGKRAETHYRTVEVCANGAVSLVECSLKTGRTHQVRVHMTALGHPLVGDSTYGKVPKSARIESLRPAVEFPRQALHSYKMSFEHPSTGEIMRFEIPLPPDMRAVMDAIG